MIWFLLLVIHFANAEVQQPYIDSLKKGLPEEPKEGTYIDSIKKKIKPQPYDNKNYIEALKEDPSFKRNDENTSYTEEQKTILPSAEAESAIDEFKQGKSELKLKRPGQIKQSAGVRIGIANSRTFSATSQASGKPFRDVYKKKWVPDVTVLYENHPFYSETFGSAGFFASLGYTQFKGTGIFVRTLTNIDGNTFGSNSRTEFRFHLVPLMGGLSFRLNTLKYVRPYVKGGGALMAYFESRSDDVKGHQGRSFGYSYATGIAFLLDWINKGYTWDLYSEQGVKHYYLTIEYNRLETFKGNVDFTVSGIYGGLSFDF